jgi:hypothetical protein
MFWIPDRRDRRGGRAVIAWSLDLLLPMQSLSITTDVVNSNLDQDEVYNILW